MQQSKRKALQAKGWKLGSATDFLGLSPEEAAVIKLKMSLGRACREHRKKRKLTQHAVAKAIASSQSRVAKMESGDPSVSLDLLVKSLLTLGATRKDVARAIAR